MATLPILAPGTFTDVSNTAITGTEPVLEAIASAVDSTYVYTVLNATGTATASFALADMPTDFGNMDTLSVRLRYHWATGTQVNTWDTLRARVYKSDGTTPLTNEATVASSITTTTATNSSVIAFTGVDTAATKEDWNGAILRVYWSITKVKGGDSIQKRVTAGELTGTYTVGFVLPADAGAYAVTGTAATLTASYLANAVHFDGTNDYLTRGADLTGNADGKTGTVSVWLNVGLADGVIGVIACAGTTRFVVLRDGTANKLIVRGRNTTPTTILEMLSATSVTGASGWVHLLASWDLAAGVAQLYLTDVEDRAASPIITNDNIDYTHTEWLIGSWNDFSRKWLGDVADLWFDLGYIDLSVETNRRKFIDASGKPVRLGADGSAPTGTAPIVYQSGATVDWHTNKGTGGGFTENGALTDATTSPSDEAGVTLAADVGSYSVTGTATSLEVGYKVAADVGSYAISGVVATLVKGLVLAVDAGSYTVTGTAATLSNKRLLVAEVGGYSISGTAATLKVGHELNAESGSYAISGDVVGLEHGWLLSAAGGSYGISGTDATLTVAGVGGVTLPADGGVYIINGVAAGTLVDRRLLAGSGSYVLTGADATLTLLGGKTLVADAGSYALTGGAVGLLWGREVQADVGNYVITGVDALFSRGLIFPGDPGSYAITGSLASFMFGRNLVASEGGYVLSGAAIDLTKTTITLPPNTPLSARIPVEEIKLKNNPFIRPWRTGW
jgi:hypothetical protein